ncbi:major facilitator superfamily domain-containing protein [Gigaspora margarita]|uniref:Major facilitator superfamily domain-containing protein n=1 Tax=Gigaspora margarita TaxID=4874 RepID=A0A8H3XJZ4_GIGMA|nr:major facilitator superfamily domain-containing protein [Gigaspora margarita]
MLIQIHFFDYFINTGMFEAGFPPSNTAYIGLFYARKELTFRYSIFMVITTISGALSGFVSYFILQISGTSLTGFQWLFIIENIPTIFLALIIAIFVTRGPGDARFFTPEEREFAVERLKSEGGPTKRVDRDLAKAQIKLTFADIQTYFYFFIVLISAIPNFVLNFYLPTLVNQLGYDAIQAQLMVIPPILVSTVVTTFNSWCSDRYNTRAWNILIGYSFSIIALVGMIATRADDPSLYKLRYFFLILLACGAYSVLPILFSWCICNNLGQYKRSTALAMIFTSAQMGGIVGILIYPANDAPSFLMGNSICLASVILSAILVTVLKFYLESLNKKRDLIILANHDYKLNDNDLKYNNRISEIAMSLVEKEPKFDEVLCDKHLNWRYIT